MREKRISRTQCNLGVPGALPLSSRVHCGRSRCGRPHFSNCATACWFARGSGLCPRYPQDITVIDDKIAIARENLRELIEQAAAYSGAADDELVAQRITEQEARLQLLTKQRNKLSQKAPNQGERHEEEPHQEEHGGHRGRRCSRRNCRSRDRRQNQTHSGR